MFNLSQGHAFYNVSASDWLHLGTPQNCPWPFHSHSSGHRNRVRQLLPQSQKPHLRPLPANRHWGARENLKGKAHLVSCRNTEIKSRASNRGEGEPRVARCTERARREGRRERAAERFHPCLQKTENGKLESFPMWP